MECGAEAATFLVSQRQASADPPHDGVHDREAKAGPCPVATCTAVEAFAGVRDGTLQGTPEGDDGDMVRYEAGAFSILLRAGG